jgi:hypothetical protein
MIVTKQSTQELPVYHLIRSAPYFHLWLDQPVFKTLIIALRMMMSQAIHQNIPDSTELRGGGCHSSPKTSQGEHLDIEEPVACRHSSALQFHATLRGMHDATQIRDEVGQVHEPREKCLLAAQG